MTTDLTVSWSLEWAWNYFMIYTLWKNISNETSTIISSLSAPSLTIKPELLWTTQSLRDKVKLRSKLTDSINPYYSIMISETYRNSLGWTEVDNAWNIAIPRMVTLSENNNPNVINNNWTKWVVFRNFDTDSAVWVNKMDDNVNFSFWIVRSNNNDQIYNLYENNGTKYYQTLLNSARYEKWKIDNSWTLIETSDGWDNWLLQDWTIFANIFENSQIMKYIGSKAENKGMWLAWNYDYLTSIKEKWEGIKWAFLSKNSTWDSPIAKDSTGYKSWYQQWELNLYNNSQRETRAIVVEGYNFISTDDVYNQIYLATTLYDFKMSNEDLFCNVWIYKLPPKSSVVWKPTYQDFLLNWKDFNELITSNWYIDTTTEPIHWVFNQDTNIDTNFDTSEAIALINDSDRSLYTSRWYLPWESNVSKLQTWWYNERGYVVLKCEWEAMNKKSFSWGITTYKNKWKNIGGWIYELQAETFTEHVPKIIKTSYYWFNNTHNWLYRATWSTPNELVAVDKWDEWMIWWQSFGNYWFIWNNLTWIWSTVNELIMWADFYINERIDDGNYWKITWFVQNTQTWQIWTKSIFLQTKKSNTDWELSLSMGNTISTEAANANRDQIAIEKDSWEPLLITMSNNSSARIEKDNLSLVLMWFKAALWLSTDTYIWQTASNLNTSCSSDWDFECITDTWDIPTERQDDIEFIKWLIAWWDITAYIKDATSTIETYTWANITTWTSPQNWKIVINSNPTTGFMMFYMPADRKYLESQEKFQIEIKWGDFSWTNWWKDATSSNKEATWICSGIIYETWTSPWKDSIIADNSCKYFKATWKISSAWCFDVISWVTWTNAETYNPWDEANDSICVYEQSFDDAWMDKSICNWYLVEDIKTEVYDSVRVKTQPKKYFSSEKLDKGNFYDFYTKIQIWWKKDWDFLKEIDTFLGLKWYFSLEPEDTRINITQWRSFIKSNWNDEYKVFRKEWFSSTNINTQFDVYDYSSWKIKGCFYWPDSEYTINWNVKCDLVTDTNNYSYLSPFLWRARVTWTNSSNGRSIESLWTDSISRTTWYWYRWKATQAWIPKTKVVLNFLNDPKNGNMSWKTCELWVFNFNEIKEEAYEISIWTLTEEDDNFLMDDLNDCGNGSWHSQSFSLTNMELAWNKVIYNIRINNNWKELSSWEGEFWLSVPSLSTFFNNVSVTKPVWSNMSVVWWSGSNTGILLSDINMSSNGYVDLEFRLSLKERDPACLDPQVDARWYWRIPIANLEEVSNFVSFKECMLPKIYIDKISIEDWNEDNDEDPWLYANAYPFEFTECNNEIETTFWIRLKACDAWDSRIKDWNVRFNTGSTKNSFIDTLTWDTARWWVTPTISGKDNVFWNMNNANISTMVSPSWTSSIYYRAQIKPQDVDTIRLDWNYFVLTNNQPTFISLESEIPEVICSWNNSCTSSISGWILGQAIWENPTIDITTKPFLSDEGIYTWEPDELTSILHREEVDLKTKELTPTWVWHTEPVNFQMNIWNPAINSSYWLWELQFDVNLNASSEIFKDINMTNSRINSVWTTLQAWKPKFINQTLATWTSVDLSGWYNIIEDIDTETFPWNTSDWKPAMEFNAISGTSCDYSDWFEEWEINIVKNPITIENVKFSDDNNSNTDDWGWWTFDEHLPWDLFKFKIDMANNNKPNDYNNVFVRISFKDNSTSIADTDLQLNLSNLFEIEGIPNAIDNSKTDINSGRQTCYFENSTDIYCLVNDKLLSNSPYSFEIPLRIKLWTDFYNKMKLLADTEDYKYWYPMIIDYISYWTPDLNLIEHIKDWDLVYYTSDEANLPSWWNEQDIVSKDLNHVDYDTNNPANITPAPNDWDYNFYIWIPYLDIVNTIWTSDWGATHLSVWDIVEFKSTISNIGESKVRDAKLVQDFFTTWLKDFFVDVEILKVWFNVDKVNITDTAVEVDFFTMKNDADLTNNFNTDNLSTLTFQPWTPLASSSHSDYIEDNLLYNGVLYSNQTTTYMEWSSTHVDWWEIEIITKVLIKNLKNSALPQIGCDNIWNCERWTWDWENPKIETQISNYDIPFVAWWNDWSKSDNYRVHFPIPKSVLFQRKWSSYTMPTTTNPIIKWVINSNNTTVTYRVDNFIPDSYNDIDDWFWVWRNEDAIGKMRAPQAIIKLPMWIRYVPNSAKYISNLQDTTPYWLEQAMGEPDVLDVNDYWVAQQVWQKSFDHDFLTNWEWSKIEWTFWNSNFQKLKGTPFKFNFFNKSYNYYRLTDDWAIALGYTIDETDHHNFNEWVYNNSKKIWKIKAKPWENVTVYLGKMLDEVILPNNTEYYDENWNIAFSDWTSYSIIKANSSFVLTNWEEAIFNNWMEYISFNDETKVDIFKDNIEHWEENIKDYIVIAPIFTKLDFRDLDDKWHWIYEKIITNWDWSVNSVLYQWYWYIQWTKKEVEFWVRLYNGWSTNNILFTYWDIDSSLNITQYSWIFSWINTPWQYKYSDYSWLDIRQLNNNDDMLFNASNVYQQLTFSTDFWYTPPIGDPVPNPLLMYQKKDPNDPLTPFIKWPWKDQTAFAFEFNVKINTDDTVCWTEYVTSLGWNSLSWNKKDSTSADVDDIDMFCFSALRPWMAIINNDTYARGWYKYSNDVCVVKHVALMWFNANAVWWNTDTSLNNCWSRYNIKTVWKDLTLHTNNPYDILPELKDKVDKREIDIQDIMANNKIALNSTGKEIKVPTPWLWYVPVSTKIPWFQTIDFKIISKNNFAVFWQDANDAYLLTTNTEWDRWDITSKFENKQIDYSIFNDNVVIVFFTDWTYVRNIDSWVGSYTAWNIVDYTKMNEVWYRTLSNAFIVWDNWIMWETKDAWKSWEARDMKTEVWLQNWEALTSISIYWAKEIWISTSRWNVLYSNDRWTNFIKKTTGSTLEIPLINFDNWEYEFKNHYIENRFWKEDSSIDTNWNNSSLKFYNSNAFLNQKAIKSNSSTNQYASIMDIENSWINLDFSSFVKAWNVIRWDLYFDMFLSDIEKTWVPTTIEINMSNNFWWINLTNTCDFEISWNGCKNWWNTFKVEIRQDSDTWYKLDDIAWTTWNQIDRIEVYSSIWWNKTFPWEYMLFQNVRYADISNLANITQLNSYNTLLDSNTWVVPNASDNTILELTNGIVSLSSFKKADNTISGFLVLDLFIKDKTADKISKIEFGSASNKKITWNNPYWFIDGWLKNGWNTFILPFNEDVSWDISYTNKYDINWQNLGYMKFFTDTTSSINKQSFALDNIVYSDIAWTSFKYIRFYNSLQWNAFDDNISYLTDDNITWWAIEDLSIANMNFVDILIVRWTEIYWIANTPSGWASYYTLDKWTNSVIYQSGSNITIKDFDMLDYNYWYGISDTNELYSIDLISI